MRVNPKKLANLQYMYANDQTGTGLPEGTYVNLAATKYVQDNDKNGDKALSKDEVTLSKEAFDKLDKDKSGKISQNELREALKGQDSAIMSYYRNQNPKNKKASDKNVDTLLSKDKVTLSAEALSKLDTDKDGKISPSELREALKSQRSTLMDEYRKSDAFNFTDWTSKLTKTI